MHDDQLHHGGERCTMHDERCTMHDVCRHRNGSAIPFHSRAPHSGSAFQLGLDSDSVFIQLSPQPVDIHAPIIPLSIAYRKHPYVVFAHRHARAHMQLYIPMYSILFVLFLYTSKLMQNLNSNQTKPNQPPKSTPKRPIPSTNSHCPPAQRVVGNHPQASSRQMMRQRLQSVDQTNSGLNHSYLDCSYYTQIPSIRPSYEPPRNHSVPLLQALLPPRPPPSQ